MLVQSRRAEWSVATRWRCDRRGSSTHFPATQDAALDVDEQVYRSESETGHRNRAIGWMLRNFAILADEPTPTLETYFRQCAVRVTCRDLALIGATLANGGVNPVTGIRAIAEEFVDNVLSVMATCGMYDYSGEWFYQTGLPAKSGVGGGIFAVQPGRIGIGVFSPRLDAQGNSVRGIAVCRELAADLGLHLFGVSQRPVPATRLATTGRSVASKRQRPRIAAEHLHSTGYKLRLYHLQGTLAFASVEPVVRELMAHATRCGMHHRQPAHGAGHRSRRRAAVGRGARRTPARRQAAVVLRGRRVVAVADRRRHRTGGVLCRRRFCAGVRRKPAARAALPGRGVGRSRTAQQVRSVRGTFGGTAGRPRPPAREPHLSQGTDDHRGRPGVGRVVRHHRWRGDGEPARRRTASPVSTHSTPE